LAKNRRNPDDANLFREFLANGADPLQRNNLGANAIMIAKNNGLKGIADDLKCAALATLPPLDEAEYKSMAEAAVQPPLRYYE
jgi:ankyrin repeat protein